ncbi:Ti-type conjugative transfer relaxase TraA, partial [Candidatus Burkholderia verschuerenii]|uniref:Ti-type conjugative transfer relaxase TraA n=1 Tax=Candidatus Burkholderia verschuerenii TaxID=242163 RepID=UPI000AB815A7
SVFDRRDVAKALHRYINDDRQEFQSAFAKVMASPALVELQAEQADPATGEVALARYSTRDMVEIESAMAERAKGMNDARSHGVARHHVERAIARQDEAIRSSMAGPSSPEIGGGDKDFSAKRIEAGLSDEQRQAIEHITGPERIAAVVGFAGAGKSTLLAAAREAWEAKGYTVHGAALSGKAAEGLEESSGIRSRTLASWSRGWDNDRRTLGRSDVFVIDEAGMVGSRQLARFVGEAEARVAKIVLVGDHEQLQAIGAGAPFRAITEEIGHAELSEIRRQRVDWQREASVDFATHRPAEGLAAYREHGAISLAETGEDARGQIVRDYLADRDERPDGTRVAMAHRRADVRALNEGIRSALQERGELARGEDAGALTFQTNDGKREFATGDRIVFLENNRDLGVKNGMLGTVEQVEAGKPGAGPMIVAQLDGPGGQGRGERVSIPMGDYQAIDHGYATTIHKNQGATVDRAYVLASGTMDRHLTYVVMTRHREGVQLYGSQDAFTGQAGRLVEHGAAPYEHDPRNSDSYYVTLENDQGQRHTTWGVDLERAMEDAAPAIGEKIGLQHLGSTPVTLPDGTQTHRNTWKVRDAGELAYEQLESRLSRSGAKETTLDYTRDFAERRGIAAHMGVRSEIEVPRDRAAERHPAERKRIEDRAPRSSQKVGVDLAQDIRADPREDLASDRQQRRGVAEQYAGENGPQIDQKRPQQVEKQRGGMFDGLKLNARPTSSQERSERTERGERARAVSERNRQAARLGRPSEMERAVDRYARAFGAADRHVREGLPVLDAQKQEIRAAELGLDQARPGTSALMVSALQHDSETRRAMTELSGRERTGKLVVGLDRERTALADPNVRA